jgi:hypothetical protein
MEYWIEVILVIFFLAFDLYLLGSGFEELLNSRGRRR